jgi:hypothetical protein
MVNKIESLLLPTTEYEMDFVIGLRLSAALYFWLSVFQRGMARAREERQSRRYCHWTIGN